MKLLLRLTRILATASAALEMTGRLAFLRALEDAPDARSRATVLHQTSNALLRIHGIEVEERGTRPAGPALIVSNHVSYLDPLVLMAATDPFLGGYSVATPLVYASFLVNVWIGTRLRRTENPLWIGSAAGP